MNLIERPRWLIDIPTLIIRTKDNFLFLSLWLTFVVCQNLKFNIALTKKHGVIGFFVFLLILQFVVTICFFEVLINYKRHGGV